MSKMGIYYKIVPLIEIAIISTMIHYSLSFFWNTRFKHFLYALCAFFSLFALSSFLQLPVLHRFVLLSANTVIILFFVIFQQELRVGILSKFSAKGKGRVEVDAFDKFLDQLSKSVYRLGDKNTGALIALEHEDALDQFANDAVILQARFSPELLESIFTPTTPLHDGAVIIRKMSVVAASVLLPLPKDRPQITKSMGTRHYAALGMSQVTDALLIVVSEETGKISIARDGVITLGVKVDRFKGIIRSVLTPSFKRSRQMGFKWKRWWKWR